MALRYYGGAGLPPAPGQDPDDLSQHKVKPMPPPRAPRLPTFEELRAQEAALGIKAPGPELAAKLGLDWTERETEMHRGMTNATPDEAIQTLEWPFTGVAWIRLENGELRNATVQLSSERGTIVKDGATLAEAAIAALGEFEEMQAKEDVAQQMARILETAENKDDAIRQLLALVQGGQ
jgi:hypothetical protein